MVRLEQSFLTKPGTNVTQSSALLLCSHRRQEEPRECRASTLLRVSFTVGWADAFALWKCVEQCRRKRNKQREGLVRFSSRRRNEWQMKEKIQRNMRGKKALETMVWILVRIKWHEETKIQTDIMEKRLKGGKEQREATVILVISVQRWFDLSKWNFKNGDNSTVARGKQPGMATLKKKEEKKLFFFSSKREDLLISYISQQHEGKAWHRDTQCPYPE